MLGQLQGAYLESFCHNRAPQKVFLGGPVDDDSLTYLHSKPALGGLALANTPLHVGRESSLPNTGFAIWSYILVVYGMA